jgi:hypothetical protein
MKDSQPVERKSHNPPPGGRAAEKSLEFSFEQRLRAAGWKAQGSGFSFSLLLALNAQHSTINIHPPSHLRVGSWPFF